jgi:hypothetical protein
MTGFIDPRLQMMQSTFMPVNLASPYGATGAPQLAPPQLQGGLSLQQSFQQHNQSQRGTAAPRVPWALSKAEKKNYDSIFRAWDKDGSGFISGQTALEVFGQSGLDKNDLARIWTLADIDDRGKLNMAEFHVAMGLIYRKLNGNEIPEQLPAELIPPSSRDLDTSVNFLKEVLKNETRARSPSGLDAPVSRMKERSFNGSSAGAGGRQDATVYKHTDSEPPGGFYTPRSRHIDRSAVRSRDDDSPSADISDMKRQLEDAAKMLDRAAEADASRTAEDEALDREMSDLKYRVKRVQDDLEYVSRGPKTASKDEERRKLERELLNLMHDRLPDLERKIEDRARRKEREKREWERERDRRNDRFGRYDDKEDRRYEDKDSRYPSSGYRSSSREREADRDRERERERDRDRDQGYSRGGYDRDNRDRNHRGSRDYDRPRTPPATRTPPPPPPPIPANDARPAPPRPSTTPAPMKNMSPDERREYARAQAKRRIEERMQALGVTAPSAASPTIDTSVEDRLAQEKKEAEEKAKAAERQAEEREQLRRERLDNEKALKEARSTPLPTPSTSSAPPVPTPTIVRSAPPPAPTPTYKVAPPAPKSRAPAPPPPRKATAPRPPVITRTSVPTPPAPPPAPPAAPEVDPEEEKFRAREEALKKKQAERAERLRQLEAEEEEARRAEAEYEARRKAFLTQKTAATPPPPAVVEPPTPPPAQPPRQISVAPPPKPPSPPPPPPPAPAQNTTSSTNPFSRFMKESGTASSPPRAATPPSVPATNGGDKNPFFRSQTAPPQNVPAPPKSPAPPAIKTTYHTAPDSEDDWDEINEKDGDDSSDDEITSSRDTRSKIAQQLFGSILPPARPQSAGPASAPASAPSSAPAPPPAPPAPAPNFPGSDGPPPPPPPPAPTAAPSISAPAAVGDVSDLLRSIQGGARLRKAVTNDRSSAPVSGRVLGDTAPPPHISTAPRSASPPSTTRNTESPMGIPEPTPMASGGGSSSSHRQSVDWFAGLAADTGVASPQTHLPGTAEEDEEEDTRETPRRGTFVPQIQINESEAEAEEDLMADVDQSTQHRVRSLYPYEGQRPEDLSFGENLILTAHPSKSGGDWWYGTVTRDGKSGFFPKTYVQIVEIVTAKAIFAYTGSNSDELPFAEGDELTIVDRSEDEWWKAEQGGVVFIVPAAYLEIQG